MRKHLVLQTDFGLSDGAVSAMYGVILSVDPMLRVFDLTHNIEPYNIWEASYRLYQTIDYWPAGTIFVSVVDPGVGSDRLSIAAKTDKGSYIITPDNGTITHALEKVSFKEVRVIDESIHRLPHSSVSETFHGRDIYAYTAARLAANELTFTDLGPKIDVKNLVTLKKREPVINDHVISGMIDILDVRFGNLWTNIDYELFAKTQIDYGDLIDVTIHHTDQSSIVYQHEMIFGKSFADSHIGEPLLYVNSVGKIGVAINQGHFAKAHQVGVGANWLINVQKEKYTIKS